MKIIVCNIGSSSFKFQLLEVESETRLARGMVERVGTESARLIYRVGTEEVVNRSLPVLNQREAVRWTLEFLTNPSALLDRTLPSQEGVPPTAAPPVSSLGEIDGVGFKCVQAGERSGSLLLEPDVLEAMEYYRDLAPAHNPPYLEAIYMFRDLLPLTPLVGVFEPGFHTDAPEYAKVYGTPFEWYEKYGVRRYGYHGASHRYVTGEVVRRLGADGRPHRIVSCHLGGSSSLCAFRDGIAIDTSMGFTPQSGVIQGTRIGDLDPFVLPYIMKMKGISLEEALAECGRKAGLAGLSGTSGDMRDIIQKISEGCQRSRLAREKFIYDVKRYLGEYLVLMEGLDAVAFAGGIGERDADLRSRVLSSLGFLGLRIDEPANEANAPLITWGDSTIAGFVVSTDEEIVVARETARVIRGTVTR